MRTKSSFAATMLILSFVWIGIAQDSRPESVPSTRRTQFGECFRPELADLAARNLVYVTRAQLSLSWLAQKKLSKVPREKSVATPLADVINLGARLEQNMRRLEADDRMRKLVLENGMSAKGDIMVLPIGRFDWKRPDQDESKTTEDEWFLGIVIAARLPLGAVKGFDVKGEFVDREGKACPVCAHTLDVIRKNGIFVVAVPAKNTLADCKVFEGFQFRLVEVKTAK
jgi:hypothetical protein